MAFEASGNYAKMGNWCLHLAYKDALVYVAVGKSMNEVDML